MSAMPARVETDPTKYKTPIQLLALFLLVVEGFLGFWIFRATSPVERVVAGTFMFLLLGAFLYFVYKVATMGQSSTTLTPLGVDKDVQVVPKATTESAIQNPAPQDLSGPDGLYTINKPPHDWAIHTMTYAEYMADSLQIHDPDALDSLIGHTRSPKVRDILVFQGPQDFRFIPTPGKTVIDGRKLPTALEVLCPIRLAIVPMERAQPPLFVERSFEHNFALQTASILQQATALRSTRFDSSPHSGKSVAWAQFSQHVEGVTTGGDPSPTFDLNIALVGYEGDVRDHVILMSYVSSADAPNTQLAEEGGTLWTLATSFKSLGASDSQAKKVEYKKNADNAFRQFVAQSGEEMFEREFRFFLARATDWELDDRDTRVRLVRQMKAFEELARVVKYQDDDLAPMWDAVELAEKGSLADLVNEVRKSLAEFKSD